MVEKLTDFEIAIVKKYIKKVGQIEAAESADVTLTTFRTAMGLGSNRRTITNIKTLAAKLARNKKNLPDRDPGEGA